MLKLPEGESILKAYKVKNPPKKMGDGTLHLTTHGVILETQKNGEVGIELNLSWNDLTFVRKFKKNTLKIEWRQNGEDLEYPLDFDDVDMILSDIEQANTDPAIKVMGGEQQVQTPQQEQAPQAVQTPQAEIPEPVAQEVQETSQPAQEQVVSQEVDENPVKITTNILETPVDVKAASRKKEAQAPYENPDPDVMNHMPTIEQILEGIEDPKQSYISTYKEKLHTVEEQEHNGVKMPLHKYNGVITSQPEDLKNGIINPIHMDDPRINKDPPKKSSLLYNYNGKPLIHSILKAITVHINELKKDPYFEENPTFWFPDYPFKTEIQTPYIPEYRSPPTKGDVCLKGKLKGKDLTKATFDTETLFNFDGTENSKYDQNGLCLNNGIHKTEIPEKYKELIVKDPKIDTEQNTDIAKRDESVPTNIPDKHVWGNIWYDETTDEFFNKGEKIDKNDLYFVYGRPCEKVKYKENDNEQIIYKAFEGIQINELTKEMVLSKFNNFWVYDALAVNMVYFKEFEEHLKRENKLTKNNKLTFEDCLRHTTSFIGFEGDVKKNVNITLPELMLYNEKFGAFILNDHIRSKLRETDARYPDIKMTLDQMIYELNAIRLNLKFDKNLDWEMLELAMNTCFQDCIEEIFKEDIDVKEYLLTSVLIQIKGLHEFLPTPIYYGGRMHITKERMDRLRRVDDGGFLYIASRNTLFNYFPRSMDAKAAYLLKDYPLVPCINDPTLENEITNARDTIITRLLTTDEDYRKYCDIKEKTCNYYIMTQHKYRLKLPHLILSFGNKNALETIKEKRKLITREEYEKIKLGNYTLHLPSENKNKDLKIWISKGQIETILKNCEEWPSFVSEGFLEMVYHSINQILGIDHKEYIKEIIDGKHGEFIEKSDTSPNYIKHEYKIDEDIEIRYSYYSNGASISKYQSMFYK